MTASAEDQVMTVTMNLPKGAGEETGLVTVAEIAVEDHAVEIALETVAVIAVVTETELEIGTGVVTDQGPVAETEAEIGVASQACLAPNVVVGLVTGAAATATVLSGNASVDAVLKGVQLAVPAVQAAPAALAAPAPRPHAVTVATPPTPPAPPHSPRRLCTRSHHLRLTPRLPTIPLLRHLTLPNHTLQTPTTSSRQHTTLSQEMQVNTGLWSRQAILPIQTLKWLTLPSNSSIP